ncbi:hypothetical protein KI387_029571, partial [Taxus chinensis]
VDADVELMDWETDGLVVKVVVAVGVEEVRAVEAMTVLVSRSVGEAIAVVEVDALM